MARETLIHERKESALGRPRRDSSAAKAYALLHFAYVVIPIGAGVDKFFNILADWGKYLWPGLAGGNPALVMRAVGLVEIAAGLIAAFRPRLGGLIVAAWLWGIMLNLLLIPGYFDVVVRDFGLSLGALALAALARDVAEEKETGFKSSHRGYL